MLWMVRQLFIMVQWSGKHMRIVSHGQGQQFVWENVEVFFLYLDFIICSSFCITIPVGEKISLKQEESYINLSKTVHKNTKT